MSNDRPLTQYHIGDQGFIFHFCDEAQVAIIKSGGLGFSFKDENI
jgi:hypothetical protein